MSKKMSQNCSYCSVLYINLHLFFLKISKMMLILRFEKVWVPVLERNANLCKAFGCRLNLARSFVTSLLAMMRNDKCVLVSFA